jgi:hypothetical protein
MTESAAALPEVAAAETHASSTRPPRALVSPPADSVREVEVEGCLSLYRRDVDRVVVLNETASDVWRLADGTLHDDEIVELLATAYGVSADAIGDEVRATLARLVQEGFLTLDLR